ncbi:EamA/RhaT family transporter [Larsenimonas rhizosphaerae]|uniref:EamA/RhaT family transporter n=1 Tax=Larsenimonas rhizosphaerae TaxID=2944682 RepID=UPI002033A568|nr:EamA/RhaT family transporter [Larsenimonas rhizosphaerae]MCM2131390.1 EamA/RhaT family transporter [Larsenimonas rhizosphaerae]
MPSTRLRDSGTTASASSPRKRLPALGYLLAGGMLLGLSTNMAKLAGEMAVSPLAFLFWSLGGATLLLIALAALRGCLPPINAHTVEYYVVSALLFFSAIAHLGAGFVALMITLPPLLTYAGALLLKMERFQVLRAAGVLSALAGAMTLAMHKVAGPEAEMHWILLALLGPVLLAMGNLYRTLRWPVGVSGEALAPGMLIAAVVLLLGVGWLPGFSLGVPIARPEVMLLILLQSIIFAGQFLLLFLLQKAGGPVLLSLLGSAGALFSVPVAVLLQGERAPEGLLLGALLIGGGIALLNSCRVTSRPRTPPRANHTRGS